MSKNEDIRDKITRTDIENMFKLMMIFILPLVILLIILHLPWVISLIVEALEQLDKTINDSVNNIITF